MKSSAWLKRLLMMSLIIQIFPVICGAQTPTPLPTPTPTSYFQWPRADQRVNSTLGSFRSNRFHLGLDLKRAEGQAVYPSADGVIRTKEMIEGSGFTITVEHDNGQITNYLHLIEDDPPQFPDVNTPVTLATQIGEVGGSVDCRNRNPPQMKRQTPQSYLHKSVCSYAVKNEDIA